MAGRKFIHTGFVLLAIVAFAVSIFAQQPNRREQRRANQLVQEGNRAFKQRDYRNAIDKYAQAVVIVPTNPEAHFWKG